MNFSKILEKFDKLLTGRQSVFDVRLPFQKTPVTFVSSRKVSFLI